MLNRPEETQSTRIEAKVYQVISGISPEFGGASTAALAICTHLADRYTDSRLFSTDYKPGTAKGLSVTVMNEFERTQLSSRATVTLFRAGPIALGKFSAQMLFGLPKVIAKADFVHIHGQFEFPVVYAYVLCRLLRRPYGVQPHGTLEPFDLARASQRAKKLYFAIIGRRLLASAKYVAFTSLSEESRAAGFTKPGQPVVAPLGVTEVGQSKKPGVRLLPAFYRSSRDNRVLYLGRLARKKRPDLLLDAWCRMAPSDAVLTIAGPDDELSRDELLSIADAGGVRDRVQVLGNVTPEEAAWLYEQHATFVLPSLNENFGQTVVEALSRGCFVVTTPEVASSSYLSEVSGLITDVRDSAHLAVVLDAVLKAQLVRRSSSAGAVHSANRSFDFSWETTVEILAERIDRCISGGSTQTKSRSR